MSKAANKKAEAVVINRKKNGTTKKVSHSTAIAKDALNVREIDFKKATRDASMIDRELVCKQLRYSLDVTHKGRTFEVASMWQPESGAAKIQIEAEKAVLDGFKETDLPGIVVAVAKNKTLVKWLADNTSTPPAKRIKQIVRQWIRHTTDAKMLAKASR